MAATIGKDREEAVLHPNPRQGGKLLSRLLTRDSSAATPSFRAYYGVSSAGAVPFLWESQPGTPKNAISDTAVPPLTPLRVLPRLRVLAAGCQRRSSASIHKSSSAKQSSASIHKTPSADEPAGPATKNPPSMTMPMPASILQHAPAAVAANKQLAAAAAKGIAVSASAAPPPPSRSLELSAKMPASAAARPRSPSIRAKKGMPVKVRTRAGVLPTGRCLVLWLAARAHDELSLTHGEAGGRGRHRGRQDRLEQKERERGLTGLGTMD